MQYKNIVWDIVRPFVFFLVIRFMLTMFLVQSKLLFLLKLLLPLLPLLCCLPVSFLNKHLQK